MKLNSAGSTDLLSLQRCDPDQEFFRYRVHLAKGQVDDAFFVHRHFCTQHFCVGVTPQERRFYEEYVAELSATPWVSFHLKIFESVSSIDGISI